MRHPTYPGIMQGEMRSLYQQCSIIARERAHHCLPLCFHIPHHYLSLCSLISLVAPSPSHIPPITASPTAPSSPHLLLPHPPINASPTAHPSPHRCLPHCSCFLPVNASPLGATSPLSLPPPLLPPSPRRYLPRRSPTLPPVIASLTAPPFLSLPHPLLPHSPCCCLPTLLPHPPHSCLPTLLPLPPHSCLPPCSLIPPIAGSGGATEDCESRVDKATIGALRNPEQASTDCEQDDAALDARGDAGFAVPISSSPEERGGARRDEESAKKRVSGGRPVEFDDGDEGGSTIRRGRTRKTRKILRDQARALRDASDAERVVATSQHAGLEGSQFCRELHNVRVYAVSMLVSVVDRIDLLILNRACVCPLFPHLTESCTTELHNVRDYAVSMLVSVVDRIGAAAHSHMLIARYLPSSLHYSVQSREIHNVRDYAVSMLVSVVDRIGAVADRFTLGLAISPPLLCFSQRRELHNVRDYAVSMLVSVVDRIGAAANLISLCRAISPPFLHCVSPNAESCTTELHNVRDYAVSMLVSVVDRIGAAANLISLCRAISPPFLHCVSPNAEGCTTELHNVRDYAVSMLVSVVDRIGAAADRFTDAISLQAKEMAAADVRVASAAERVRACWEYSGRNALNRQQQPRATSRMPKSYLLPGEKIAVVAASPNVPSLSLLRFT
ncbi:unnamed protein product [Closterium sp. Naga37s-1]|nr:unnamed protein product [Closterium sp. Naga37s-1]